MVYQPKKSIPIRSLPGQSGSGISVIKIASDTFKSDEDMEQSHRHNHHMFVLQEKGTSITEIDFQEHVITEPSILYQSPDQIHRSVKI